MASLSGAPLRKGARGRRLQAVAPKSARAAILCGQETHGQHRGNKQSKSPGYEALYPALWSPVYTVTMLPIIPARGTLSSAPTYMHMPCIHRPAGDGRNVGADGGIPPDGRRPLERVPAVVVGTHMRLNMSCVDTETHAASSAADACAQRRSRPRELTSHFLFQPIASSDLRPQHAPALRSVVPDFEQGAGPREVFET